MAFKTSSKQKLSTSSAVSSSSSGGVIISQVFITDSGYVNLDDTAIGTGGGFIKLIGSGFVTGCNVYVNNVVVSTTFVSSGEVRAVIPSAAAGTYSLTVFNTNGGGSIWASGLLYSGFPTVTTSSYLSVLGAVVNTQIVATGDGTLSYVLQGGSTLPTGVTLSSTGLVSGTASAISVNTVVSFTVLVNDSQNQTTQQAITISLIFGDIHFKNTVALLSGDTLINTTDLSANKFAVTNVVDTTARNLTPFQGSYSQNFDGASQYLSVTSNAAFSFGTGDFTVEAWVNFSSVAASQYIVDFRLDSAAGSNQAPALAYHSPSGKIIYISGDTIKITGTTTIDAGVWYHVASVRTSGTIKLYVNGILNGTVADSGSFINYANRPIIGVFASGANTFMSGYISNLRVVKGTAVYTAAFTPSTTPLTAISGTSLLTCQNGYVRDNSTNAFAITIVAGAQVSQRTPFETTPSSTLGCTTFNGTTHYLSVSPQAAIYNLSSDFTIEFWIYSGQLVQGQVIMHTAVAPGGPTNTNWGFFERSSGTMGFVMSDGTTYQVNMDTATAVLNSSWNHIAVTRSGSAFKFFVNGVVSNTATWAGTPAAASRTIYIGSSSDAIGFFSGHISNLRIVKGTAVYTAAFTPPSSPLTAITNTSLLTLQSPVPNNNNTFLDSSPNTLPVTRVGTPLQGSFNPFGSNWSNYFDGTGDFLSIPANVGFQLTGDFTIEAWINMSVINSFNMLFGSENITGTDYCSIRATTIELVIGAANPAWTFTPSLNTWYHVAIVRSGSTLSVYANGTALTLSAGSATNSAQYLPTNSALFVGKYGGGAGLPFTGHISNFRVVKGTAVYTANFTPSISALTAITNTSLLTCQSNNFKDNSTNNFTVTKAGDTIISRYSPFSTTTGYDPSIYGGSMYFNGAQVLTVADQEVFEMQGDFTVETWFNMTATPAAFCTFLSKGASGIYQPYYFAFSSNTTLLFYSSSTGSSWNIASAVSLGVININTWNHVAVSRSGSSMRLFLNGALITTLTSSDTLFNNSNNVAIGGRSDSSEFFTGYISNTRIVKGTALYTAAFTPSTTPLTAVKNTALLLGGTNAGIVDHTMLSNYTSPAGSVVSNSLKKYGSGAIFCSNTAGNMISSSSDNGTAIGTGNFTAECWYYSGISTSTYRTLISRGNLQLRFGDSGFGDKLQVTLGTTLGVVYSCSLTSAAALNAWYHFAFTRESGVCKLWVNGVQQPLGAGANPGSYPSTTFTDTTSMPSLQTNFGNSTVAYYLDDARVTVGVARYTGNFTPDTYANLKN